MGRVSRYKKTKACDPFNLTPSKLVHRDKAPSKHELDADIQHMPRSLKNFMAYKKAQKGGSKTQRVVSLDHVRGRASKDAARSTENVTQPEPSEKKAKAGSSYKRLPRETDHDFLDRIDSEGADRLIQAQRDLKPLADKRKKYLNQKKKKKRQMTYEEEAAELAKTDRVRFGEVVQEPPSLSAKPRKAPAKTTAKLVSNLQLQKDSISPAVTPTLSLTSAGMSPSSPTTSTAGLLCKGGEQRNQPKKHKKIQAKTFTPPPPLVRTKKHKEMSAQERQRLDLARSAAINFYRHQKAQQSHGRSSDSV